MRIAVFHNQPSGGARRALAGFCRHLAGDHEIDVFALSTADDEWIADAALGRPMARREWRPSEPIRGGFWLDDLRQDRDRRALGAVNEAVAGDIDAGGYDVCLVDVCRFTLVPEVLRFLRTPAVHYVHQGPMGVVESARRPVQSRWERLRDDLHAPAIRVRRRRLLDAQRHAVAAATVVVANSHHTAGRVREAWGRDAVVCPPGVEIPAGEAVDRRAGEVLSVGEIEAHKDFGFLVASLATMPPPLRPGLRICAHRSDPRTERKLREQARAARVVLTIELDPAPEVLSDAYARAGAFLFAARNEALGLAPLEAMAHGCAVVAVGEAGVRETVDHERTGLLVGRDPAAFGQAVGAVLGDAGRRDGLGRAARESVGERWSWEVRASGLEEQLALVAGAAPRRAPA